MGQVPVDLGKTGVDALLSAGYRWLCGPFGAAITYVAPHLQRSLGPGTVGWRSHKEIWQLRADRYEFPGNARRFEASTMAYGRAVGLARAVEYLNKIGIDRIYAHNLALGDRLAADSQQIWASHSLLVAGSCQKWHSMDLDPCHCEERQRQPVPSMSRVHEGSADGKAVST